ncbi:hypothetical protein G7Y79_00028g062140 [Physcia stellaris]|nr:hypothetical protein G7Y79_00028g062140 [Physcia stellaris]
MARSSGTTPEQRAQLLRELSQDLNRTRNSSASTEFSQGTASPDITTSSFDPENEALVSTHQFDPPEQHLQQLRVSAENLNKFSRPSPRSEPRSEPDYAINTSAIGRAFPDFTQGSRSSSDGSMSIEIGRGLKKGSSNTIGKLGRSNRSQTSAMSNRDDSFDFSAPMIGNHYVASTPPLVNPKTRKHNGTVSGKQVADSQVRQSSGLRNEVRDTISPPIKTKDNVSDGSRQGSGKRQTLAAMHARVRDENDVSNITEDRPATIDLTARSSRFSSAKHQVRDQHNGLPARFNSKQDFVQKAPSNDAETTATQRPLPKGVPTSNPTTQSVVLPQMPNVSELLSGVFEDGTPVFSASGKARSSRFTSGSRKQQRQISGVDEIDVPQEEQDIYMSLQIAEDRVVDLERIRAEAEYAIGELQERNRILEAEKADRRRRQRSDSAIGLTESGSDAGDEMSSGQRKLLIEKNRLESSVRLLSSQVGAFERKVAVSDITLRNVTKERDLATSQLGVAYVTVEQLKSENEKLVNENQELKAQLASNAINQGTELRHESYKENQSAASSRRQASNLLNGSQTNTNDAQRLVEGSTENEKRQSKVATNDKNSKLRFEERLAAHAAGNAQSRKDFDGVSKPPTRNDNSRFSRCDGTHVTDLFPPTEQTQRSVDFAESERSEDSDIEQTQHPNAPSRKQQACSERGDLTQNSTKDLTYLSFQDSDEVAELRRRLEYERLERKQQKTSRSLNRRSRDNTVHSETIEQPEQPKLPRKFSLKSTTRRVTDPVDTTEQSLALPETDPTPKVVAEHNRRHSETSVDVRRQQRRKQEAENMTSAFILPDITIRQPLPELSAAGEKVLDDLKNHKEQNCIVCHQTVKSGSNHDHTGATKASITIPKPVPVSDRMPEPTEYNEDPTIRPSQPPAFALAFVLKGLEDELAHQKMQLAHYQKLYTGHDPALSKRQRKSVYAKVETLLKDIDVKSDQIYSLYDVLEGQKQDGHQITEQEVEVTLQSIGVDVADLGLRGGDIDNSLTNKPAERHPWDLDSNDGSEEDLPWEGIESTAGTTKSNHCVKPRRGSSAA